MPHCETKKHLSTFDIRIVLDDISVTLSLQANKQHLILRELKLNTSIYFHSKSTFQKKVTHTLVLNIHKILTNSVILIENRKTRINN